MTEIGTTTAIDAFRVSMGSTGDVSGLVALARDGGLRPDDVVAVTGKTEGWGAGYDASRVDADRAVRRFLTEHGSRTAAQIGQVPMAFSAGVGTILTPHLVVYTRTPASPAPGNVPRLALGAARSDVILPEWVGTGRGVEANAEAVRRASADAGIRPEEVEFVVGKAYYPTQAAMAAARAADLVAADYDPAAMFRFGSGSAALGVGSAVDGLVVGDEGAIGRDPELWSGRLAVSANPWEDVGGTGPQTQLMVFGNATGHGGRLRVGHAVFQDVLDVDAVPRALRRAGVEAGPGPLAPELTDRIVAVYMKINAGMNSTLRGRRQVVEDPSYSSSMKTVVASAFSSMLQDTHIWISGGGIQQGPVGGGTLAIVIDVAGAP